MVRKWATEFLALTVVQTTVFGIGLWSVLSLVGLNYGMAVVIGVPFFGILTAVLNAILTMGPPQAVRLIAVVIAMAIHVFAWGEDLNTRFFVSSAVGITLGAGLILARGRIVGLIQHLCRRAC